MAIEHDQDEIDGLEDGVSSCISQKESYESDLQKDRATLESIRKEIADKNHEVFLVTTQPYFRWGSLIAFSSALIMFLVVSLGLARCKSIIQSGLRKVLDLPRRIRRAQEVKETKVLIEPRKTKAPRRKKRTRPRTGVTRTKRKAKEQGRSVRGSSVEKDAPQTVI
jgi:hypothetical protein